MKNGGFMGLTMKNCISLDLTMKNCDFMGFNHEKW